MRRNHDVWPRTGLEASDGHLHGMRDVYALEETDVKACAGVSSRRAFGSTRWSWKSRGPDLS